MGTIITRIKAITVASGLVFLSGCASAVRISEKYAANLEFSGPADPTVISEKDLEGLPPIVQKYFRYSRVIGKKRISSFAFSSTGRIKRSPDGDWMPITSRQLNALNRPSRIYHINADSAPMQGVDSFIDGAGGMQIILFGFLSIGKTEGPEADISGLVTFMNDMMVYPAACFSVPLEWRHISDTQAEMIMEHAGLRASALLTFDEEGRLVNWESSDRFAEIKGEMLPDRWSTQIDEYGESNGMRIPVRGTGYHNYDGTLWAYVEFNLDGQVAVNATTLPGRK